MARVLPNKLNYLILPEAYPVVEVTVQELPDARYHGSWQSSRPDGATRTRLGVSLGGCGMIRYMTGFIVQGKYGPGNEQYGGVDALNFGITISTSAGIPSDNFAPSWTAAFGHYTCLREHYRDLRVDLNITKFSPNPNLKCLYFSSVKRRCGGNRLQLFALPTQATTLRLTPARETQAQVVNLAHTHREKEKDI